MSENPRPMGQPIIAGTASWAHRLGALVVDWLACYFVAFFILRDVQHPAFGVLTIGLFLFESALGVALSGGSFGQLVTRIRVHRIDGTPLPLLSAFARQALVCLVIPPLVFREDGRGLHDLLTKSAAYPLRRNA
ncbi:RDD family protein [Marmoricola sp. RAF53]|uniref:RDD family protein n=1 Tax=Marmoricola sp. RAF53 TaxID=3233059 RepID=UPI003F9B2F95